MKKYIKPAIVNVEVENECILAASPIGRDATPLTDGNNIGANDFDLDWDEE